MNVGEWVRRVFRRSKPEGQMSVMPAWTIWVGGLGVLVVGALSGWLLLSHFGAGTAQDRVQLEILRLTGSIALGSGGAVALLLAARRQRATEVDIAQKKQATEDARHDATERRVTELYTKAAEQLGSDKAAVRLAGLYALERLAQDNPDHRQTVVEVICAYLRMPYTPPSDHGSARSIGQVRRRRGLRPPSRSNMAPSPMRTMKSLASSLNDMTEQGQDQHQELQVRLAAQHILTTHLCPYADKAGEPTNLRFWPALRIDLAGAALVNWNMSGGEVDLASFEGAAFYGYTAFSSATFKWLASFRKATFYDTAIFEGATARRTLMLQESKFYESASFNRMAFGEIADFTDASFEDVEFKEANFYGPTWFLNAVFHKAAEFDRAKFHWVAWLDKADFYGKTSFQEVVFLREDLVRR